MKRGAIVFNKIVILILVIAVLIFLVTLLFKVQDFKELFVSLLESFK